jgi:hypothetical protein
MITYPHRIRLRGPWECDLPSGVVRVMVPCRWADAGVAVCPGRVRVRRRFGYPGRIDTFERVWLTFGGVSDSAQVWLNGAPLGRHEGRTPFEYHVTNYLRPRNELAVMVDWADATGGLWGEVALEVRRTAFLRRVQAWPTHDGRITVTGEVVGTCERPLDLYALVGPGECPYARVEAAPEGRRFQLTSDEPDEETLLPRTIRVDLVDAAVIWYTVEAPLEGSRPKITS